MKIEKKRYDIIFLGVLLILLVGCFIFGLFFDLKFSQSIYDKNSIFGMLFASFGELPAWFMVSMGAVMLYKIASSYDVQYKKIICNSVAILLVLFSTFMIYYCESSSWNGFSELTNSVVMIFIAVILQTIFLVIGFLLIKTEDRNLLWRGLILFLGVVAVEIALIYGLKILWDRPRYRLIYEGSDFYSVFDLFQSWWEPGDKLASQVFSGVPSEQFKSFPSGHTADAATSFLIFFLPSFNDKFKKKISIRIIFVTLALIWTTVVALSRIVYGAHYITDVSFGFIVTIIVILCGSVIVFKHQKGNVNVKAD